jgi:hypothetical protein
VDLPAVQLEHRRGRTRPILDGEPLAGLFGGDLTFPHVLDESVQVGLAPIVVRNAERTRCAHGIGGYRHHHR